MNAPNKTKKTRTVWLLELKYNHVIQGDGEFWPTRKDCLHQLGELGWEDASWEARITKIQIPNTGKWRKVLS